MKRLSRLYLLWRWRRHLNAAGLVLMSMDRSMRARGLTSKEVKCFWHDFIKSPGLRLQVFSDMVAQGNVRRIMRQLRRDMKKAVKRNRPVIRYTGKKIEPPPATQKPEEVAK